MEKYFDEKLIYSYDHAISPVLCKTIIEMFETEDSRYKGITNGGYNPTNKETMDFVIPNVNSRWERVSLFLNKELSQNLKVYLNQLNIIDQLNILSPNYLGSKFLQYDSFMIQKYEKNKGKFNYHNDFICDYEKSRFRLVTFIFYLNDVNVGGETEFFGHKHVRPTAGKLLLFPATWTFPHCGKIPISSDKYIITGWLYINSNHFVNKRVNDILNKTI